jgi:hypothetical protein
MQRSTNATHRDFIPNQLLTDWLLGAGLIREEGKEKLQPSSFFSLWERRSEARLAERLSSASTDQTTSSMSALDIF